MLDRLQNNSQKQLLLFFGILTAIVFLAMRSVSEPLITSEAPGGIISFELAKSLEQSQAMLASWDTNTKINAGLSLGIDFLFLFVYGIFFAVACFSVAKKFKDRTHWFYTLGVYLAWLQLVAALFDAIENAALIKLLLGSLNSVYSSIAYYFASIKFVIIAIGIIYIIIGLLSLLFQKGLTTD